MSALEEMLDGKLAILRTWQIDCDRAVEFVARESVYRPEADEVYLRALQAAETFESNVRDLRERIATIKICIRICKRLVAPTS